MSLITENRNKGFNYVQESSPVAYEDGLTWYKSSTKITYISNNGEWKEFWIAATCENDIPGTLWACGRNNKGQLGLNDTIDRSSPVQVGTDIDWKKIVNIAGFGTVLKSNGTLWAWGDNSSGQLGLNDRVSRSSPVQVGTDTNWMYIDSTYLGITLAIKTDGTLWAWGYNNYGELGLNDRIYRSSPVQVGTDTNYINTSLMHNYSLAQLIKKLV